MDSGFLKKLISSVTGRKGGSKFDGVSDEELVKVYLDSKDESAFEEIVTRYGDRIYGFALRLTRNPGRAEDIFQEVFLTLAEKIHTFRGESKFSSWLYRVSMNTGYMHLRASKKHESSISIDSYAPYDDEGTLGGKIKSKDWGLMPDKVVFSKEALALIDEAANELPESYRMVFHLRDVEGMTNEEVSRILDISVAAVKSRLHRARLYLRDKLSDYFYEGGK